MEQRLANTWHMTQNEKKFIETALLSDRRIDGRRPFDYRQLTINFGREYGSSEVQLGQTHVMGFVTAQLVQPYRDRPNEGFVAIYTEFSPMADPSFEAGRPGESAVELGRIIDRGLRESMAVDTESLCVLAGKLVWSIRIDLHVLDNGGNLVDAANIAALVALKTFRRSECTLEGEDRQKVTVHPPEGSIFKRRGYKSFEGFSCISSKFLFLFLLLIGTLVPKNKDSEQIYGRHSSKGNSGESGEKKIPLPLSVVVPNAGLETNAIKTLKDAVKPKNKRRKDLSSSTNKR